MDKHQRRSTLAGMILIGTPFIFGSAVHAAKPVDLRHQPVSMNVKEISRTIDLNKTMHIRMQQTYNNYRVWGADAVLHIPNGKQGIKSISDALTAAQSNNGFMNGNFYNDLRNDLGSASNTIFTSKQLQNALTHVIASYKKLAESNAMNISDQKGELIVYVDGNQKAHWAYKIDFYAKSQQAGKLPQKPNYIIDAITLEVYQQWDNIQTVESDVDVVDGGGLGGNKNMGQYDYDGLELPNHLSKLHVTRDAGLKTCSLKNTDVTILNYQNNKVVTYNCETTDKDHNDVYWVEKLDPVNGGYSPSDDALFGGQVIKSMYQDWYNVPVLTENGEPMMLDMVVHERMDNAYWDGRRMTFGDGISMFYPLTSLGVASHEISHGFTEQHSNLSYYGQSGGMNEAFSDMAAQAAEFYAYGKSSYQIGPEIMKQKGTALRYMDKPSKDCKGKKPGSWCSIDSASQYYNGLDVHFSSGVYNMAYYTLATTEGWDQRKAFDVMVKANSDYWTSGSSFNEGACGVMHAAKDLNLDTDAVVNAFKAVDVKTSQCD